MQLDEEVGLWDVEGIQIIDVSLWLRSYYMAIHVFIQTQVPCEDKDTLPCIFFAKAPLIFFVCRVNRKGPRLFVFFLTEAADLGRKLHGSVDKADQRGGLWTY